MIELTLRPRHAVELELKSECAKAIMLETPNTPLKLAVMNILIGPSGPAGAIARNTDELPEGLSNLYHTPERAAEATRELVVGNATDFLTYYRLARDN